VGLLDSGASKNSCSDTPILNSLTNRFWTDFEGQLTLGGPPIPTEKHNVLVLDVHEPQIRATCHVQVVRRSILFNEVSDSRVVVILDLKSQRARTAISGQDLTFVLL